MEGAGKGSEGEERRKKENIRRMFRTRLACSTFPPRFDVLFAFVLLGPGPSLPLVPRRFVLFLRFSERSIHRYRRAATGDRLADARR